MQPYLGGVLPARSTLLWCRLLQLPGGAGLRDPPLLRFQQLGETFPSPTGHQNIDAEGCRLLRQEQSGLHGRNFFPRTSRAF